MRTSFTRIFIPLLTCLVAGAACLSNAAGAQQVASEPASQLTHLEETIEESIQNEQASLLQYRNQFDLFQREKTYLAAAINGYEVQLSTYGTLILASGVDIASTRKAWTELRAAKTELQKTIDEMAPRLEAIAVAAGTIDQQKVLVEKQIAELQQLAEQDPAAPALQNRASALSRILTEKGTVLGQLHQAVSEDLEHLKRIRESFATLSDRFESTLAKRKNQHLFERRKWPLSGEGLALFREEMNRLGQQTKTLARPVFWIEKSRELWKSIGPVLLALAILVGVVLVLFNRILQVIARAETHPIIDRLGPWHRLVLQVIQRSFLLAGVTLLFYVYARLELLYLAMPLLHLLAGIFMVALTTRWAKRLLYFWPDPFALPSRIVTRLQRLITAIRYFCWIYLVVEGILENAPVFLLLIRLIFEGWFLTWIFAFWRDRSISRQPDGDAPPANRQRGMIIGTGKTVGYFIAGTAFFLELAGYGPLARHWLLSWGRSAVVFLWGIGFFLLLREWDRYYREKNATERDELLQDEYPLQWLMIRFGQLVWGISLVVALILAWGARQVVLVRIYESIGHPLQFGNMRFSILGILYALLVLLAVRALVRMWRWLFQTKFLNRSGMEVGLQDSITTITVYAIWMFGILIALHVFGISSASLTVAFGALGIGLGFGLQNIFNNFISGIILLFERPIQVGDDVEINGTWASVKKINVRSTVVQTYDNASLIIPNSEFISSQVTNWSFKDKRIRIKIVVGVAYGSDVALTRDTLIEIAHRTPKVLKHPAPDVLFSDFGDSALIFKLRVWTDIDNMLKAGTAIRFEIDRLFREKGIEIAFPQRDIHIRSTVADHSSESPMGGGAGHMEMAENPPAKTVPERDPQK